MRVSVVIPTYNSADRLRRSVAAALAQTAPPFEVIVVDDGSSDGTPEVCAGFGNAVQTIRLVNGGQQIARNRGVAAASGDWIALLDHDDLWEPDYLAEIQVLQESQEVDFVLCNSVTMLESSSGSTIKDPGRFTHFAPPGYWDGMGADPGERWSVLERFSYRHYLAFHPAQPSVMVIRKDFYERLGGYDPRLRGSSAENFEFELRAIQLGRVGLVWRPLATIIRHADNASVDGSKMAMDLVACLKFALEHHVLNDDERAAIRAELQRRLPDAMTGAFTLRRFAELRGYEAQAVRRPDIKTTIKCGVARLPLPLANLCAAALTGRMKRAS